MLQHTVTVVPPMPRPVLPSHVVPWHGASSSCHGAWHAAARCVTSRHGAVRDVWPLNMAWRGEAWRGVAWRGAVRSVWRCGAGCVVAWHGARRAAGHGVACGHPTCHVMSWRGVWWCGVCRGAVCGVAWRGVRRCGAVRGVQPPDVGRRAVFGRSTCRVTSWHGVQPRADGLGTCKKRKKGRGTDLPELVLARRGLKEVGEGGVACREPRSAARRPCHVVVQRSARPRRVVAWRSARLCCPRCVMAQRGARPSCPSHVMVRRGARPSCPSRVVAWRGARPSCPRCVMAWHGAHPCCPCHVMAWHAGHPCRLRRGVGQCAGHPCRPCRVVARCHTSPVAGWRHRGAEGVVSACKQNLKRKKKKRKSDLLSRSMLAQCRRVTVPRRNWEVGPV